MYESTNKIIILNPVINCVFNESSKLIITTQEEKIYVPFLIFKKSKLNPVNQFLDQLFTKVKFSLFFTALSNNILVIKIEVNKEVAIPISKVVAKPLMGPVPNINKIAPVKT